VLRVTLRISGGVAQAARQPLRFGDHHLTHEGVAESKTAWSISLFILDDPALGVAVTSILSSWTSGAPSAFARRANPQGAVNRPAALFSSQITGRKSAITPSEHTGRHAQRRRSGLARAMALGRELPHDDRQESHQGERGDRGEGVARLGSRSAGRRREDGREQMGQRRLGNPANARLAMVTPS